MSAWVRWVGWRPVAAVQDRKFWAWMNRCPAYLLAVGRSGPLVSPAAQDDDVGAGPRH